MSFKVIGLCGNLGAGKDTFARWLMELGIAQENTSFAKALKLTAKQLFGVEVGERSDHARHVLQQLGTKMRDIDPEVWVKQVEREITKSNKTFVITDVRFENEAQWITIRDDGLLIILNCPEDVRRRRVANRDYGGNDMGDHLWNKWHDHASEKQVMDIKRIYSDDWNTITVDQEHSSFYRNKRLFIRSLHDRFPKLIEKPVF